jgi:integrating conjugative element relaxase (TIGR03760 family)
MSADLLAWLLVLIAASFVALAMRPLLSDWLLRLPLLLNALRMSPLKVKSRAIDASAPTKKTSEPVDAIANEAVQGSKPNWLKVFSGPDLLKLVGAKESLEALVRESRLSKHVFERDLLPALNAYAEFTQLLPASEAHHHAHRGGLLGHTLEVTLAAMRFRNGYLLPKGGAAEAIAQQRDWWTYAVFYAALLHDVGKPITDLRIHWVGAKGGDPLRWIPVTGSLTDCGATQYQVGFAPKSERDYGAHSKLGISLLQRMAPQTALSFMAQQPEVIIELTQLLAGENRQSVLAEVVKRADQLSTSRNLVQGTRARFATATAIPLHELMHHAMSDLLRQGVLPLNRDGACGWVFDGSIWFVAKRLADTLREHIKKHAGPDAGFPGEAKNDRLFDTWQDFGVIQLSPQGKAIWYATVHGTDGAGYAHRLSLLRFPLSKLWDDPENYPLAMVGHIEAHAKDDAKPQAGPGSTDFDVHDPTITGLPAASSSVDTPSNTDATDYLEPSTASTLDEVSLAASTEVKSPAGSNTGSKVNKGAASGVSSVRGPKPVATPGPKHAQAAATRVSSSKSERLPETLGGVAQPLKTEANGPATPKSQAVKPMREQVDVSAFDLDESCLEEDDVAVFGKAVPAARLGNPSSAGSPASTSQLAPQRSDGPAVQAQQQGAQGKSVSQTEHTAARSTTQRSDPVPASSGPVALPSPALPKLPGSDGAEKKAPSPLAIEFMRWLQHGLATRQILYNQSGAPVHFVAAGMLLVSPAIFRRYAEENDLGSTGSKPDRLGMDVQREFLKAGWHAPSIEGNICHFAVLKRGGVASSRLSAVVLPEPKRWVTPVPPDNPALKPFKDVEQGA